MQKTVIRSLTAFYILLLLLFFLLFIEDSPFRKKRNFLKLQDVFSIGWNFFTKGPKEDLTRIYFYRGGEWIELGEVSFFSKFTKQKDAVQTEISAYASFLPDSVWKDYSSEENCIEDPTTFDPTNNNSFSGEIRNKYHSKEYIISNYSDYFLLINEKKLPWAWLNTYPQNKMKCRRLILRL